MSKETKNVIDEKTLQKIKEDLLERRKQILDDLEDIRGEGENSEKRKKVQIPEYGDKPDENAQEISEYTTNLATESVLEKTLRDIDNALDRIEKGTYGKCKYCGQPINEKRLLARPVASACVECKTKLQEES